MAKNKPKKQAHESAGPVHGYDLGLVCSDHPANETNANGEVKLSVEASVLYEGKMVCVPELLWFKPVPSSRAECLALGIGMEVPPPSAPGNRQFLLKSIPALLRDVSYDDVVELEPSREKADHYKVARAVARGGFSTLAVLAKNDRAARAHLSRIRRAVERLTGVVSTGPGFLLVGFPPEASLLRFLKSELVPLVPDQLDYSINCCQDDEFLAFVNDDDAEQKEGGEHGESAKEPKDA